MKNQALTLALVALSFAAGGAAIGYWSAHVPAAEKAPMTAASPAGGAERKPLYWYDPMVPNQHFDKPGKSPFMDMQLVPKYGDERGDDTATVNIDPARTQNLGLRLATVTRGELARTLDAVGMLAWNERDVAIVQARSGGFVQRVYGRAPGDVVPAGAPLADVLVPEWAGAQAEFLALAKAGDPALVDVGRQRLRLLGMPPALIAAVERNGTPKTVVTVNTPIGGVIQTLEVRDGMTLTAGQVLAKVNGLATVWLDAALPEVQGGQIHPGAMAQIRLTAFPGETRQGKVVTVQPEANADSRTLKVRIELPNRDGKLRPGMSAQLSLATPRGAPVLQVPSESVIRTGKRALVMVAEGRGRYRPVEIRVGQEAGGLSAVLEGLSEGQQVVASGQFLIDSEASLSGIVASAAKPAVAPPDGGHTMHHGVGKVESVSATEVTLSHDPIASIGWGAMTMPFQLARPELARGLKVGDRVEFDFVQQDGRFIVQALSKTGSRP